MNSTDNIDTTASVRDLINSLKAEQRAHLKKGADIDQSMTLAKARVEVAPDHEGYKQELADLIEAKAEWAADREMLTMKIRSAEQKWEDLSVDVERDQIKAEAADYRITFPDNFQPLDMAALLNSAYESFAFNLANGEAYYLRQCAKVKLRSSGSEADEANPEADDAIVAADANEQLERVEKERRHRRVILEAIKQQYKEISEEFRPHDGSWWPPLQRKNDAEIRRQADQVQAKRTAAYLAEQDLLRKEAASFGKREARIL